MYSRQGDTLKAFQHISKANSVFRFDPEVRKNLVLALAGLMRRKNVKVSQSAMDRAIERAESAAKYSPAVMMIKAEYLLRTKRPQEAEAVFAEMRRYAPRKAAAWLARLENG